MDWRRDWTGFIIRLMRYRRKEKKGGFKYWQRIKTGLRRDSSEKAHSMTAWERTGYARARVIITSILRYGDTVICLFRSRDRWRRV
jgi:hypothetical protein